MKTLKVAAAAALIFTGVRMSSNEFNYYGLIAGEMQLKSEILTVCKIIAPHNADDAALLLAETIAVESRNGKAKDYSPNYGEGLTQFDKIGFNEVKRFIKNKPVLHQKILDHLGINVLGSNYNQLRKSPRLAIVFGRLLYLSKPNAIPTTLQGRWEYYKKYFNSTEGATTKSKYYAALKYAVFKDEETRVYNV